MKEFLTLSEALSRLALYDEADRIMSELDAVSLPDNPQTECDYEFADSTPEGYGLERLKAQFFDIEAKSEESFLEEAVEKTPEIGDIAILSVELTSPKSNKKLYLGYERRPVLILRVNNNHSIDGLEITPSNQYLGNELINIGKVSDDENSYVNIYTSTKYRNIQTNYKFPLFDISGGNTQPLTKAEVGERYFGKLYTKQKGDDETTFLVQFDYENNFVKKLSDDKLKSILTALAEYKEDNT